MVTYCRGSRNVCPEAPGNFKPTIFYFVLLIRSHAERMSRVHTGNFKPVAFFSTAEETNGVVFYPPFVMVFSIVGTL